MKRVKSHSRPTHRWGNVQLPSWVFFCIIMLATFAVCVTVTIRADKAMRDAKARYLQVGEDINSQQETNAYLASVARRPHAGRTITITELQGEGNGLGVDSIPRDQRAPSALVLLVYCLAALASGFASVRSLIALVRALARGRLIRGDNRNKAEVNYTIGHERASRAAWRQALLLVVCLLLASGFVYGVRQQIQAVEYGYKTEALRREREQLLDEQRRLLLAVEESSSPAQLEQAARELGMRPSTEPVSSTNGETSPRYNSIYSSSLSSPFTRLGLSSTTVPWATLILLTLFGGVIAVITSGLLSQIRLGSLIGRAPGTAFHSVVDFLYSPKIVRETFEPIIADWRVEYFEALSQKRVWKARWINVRYTHSFLMAMGLSKLFSFYKVFIRAGK